MLELLIPWLLAASCDVTSAALGNCGCDQAIAGQFTLCASDQTQSQLPGSSSVSTPQPKPLRLCSYYANGTIDIPTISVITTWVEVGSRLCIGDELGESFSSTPVRTVQDDLQDSITAVSDRPIAWWEPGDEVEFEDPAVFRMNRANLNFSGELLGQSAQIRFVPSSARWQFSDGEAGSGFSFTRSFPDIGSYWAQGYVEYQVDYRIGGGGWVLSAANWELAANRLQVPVIEYPRRTLLVGQ
jgi:hypothetical protein